jgi:hypothetical protein
MQNRFEGAGGRLRSTFFCPGAVVFFRMTSILLERNHFSSSSALRFALASDFTTSPIFFKTADILLLFLEYYFAIHTNILRKQQDIFSRTKAQNLIGSTDHLLFFLTDPKTFLILAHLLQ